MVCMPWKKVDFPNKMVRCRVHGQNRGHLKSVFFLQSMSGFFFPRMPGTLRYVDSADNVPGVLRAVQALALRRLRPHTFQRPYSSFPDFKSNCYLVLNTSACQTFLATKTLWWIFHSKTDAVIIAQAKRASSAANVQGHVNYVNASVIHLNRVLSVQNRGAASVSGGAQYFLVKVTSKQK